MLINGKSPKIESLYWVLKIFHFVQSTKSYRGYLPFTTSDTQHANHNHTQHNFNEQFYFLYAPPHSLVFICSICWKAEMGVVSSVAEQKTCQIPKEEEIRCIKLEIKNLSQNINNEKRMDGLSYSFLQVFFHQATWIIHLPS